MSVLPFATTGVGVATLKQPAQAPDLGAQTEPETLDRLMASFERYAGWLQTDQHALAVRSHAQALRGAVNSGAETWHWIHLLDADLQRVPFGEVRKMLRRTLTKIANALGVSFPVVRTEDRS